ncbi:MAG: (d)CMP kinase [Polyangia bacterium]
MRSRPVVAIDGPSGAGKSTVAGLLARELGFALVDTGSIYRAVAWLADREDIDWDDGPRLARLASSREFDLEPDGLKIDGVAPGDALRTARIGNGASIVARHRELRDVLLGVQRDLARDGGVVLEGRDIGTIVVPDAEIKFFLTAEVAERARRRWSELRERGEEISLERVEREQRKRDRADSERKHSPLRRAGDAVVIDCTNLGIDEVVSSMKNRVKNRFPLT